MFDKIARRYDLLNHLLSVNIDKRWRKRGVDLLIGYKPLYILDIATGTADFAIECARLQPERITGVDLSDGMLKVAVKKVERRGLTRMIELMKGDAEALSFKDSVFDAVTVGFGVRNFENLMGSLAEIHRVLKPGGAFIVLEFSRPRNPIFRRIYFFYFNRILPFLGRKVSKDSRAYTYLPESVHEFPDGDDFAGILEKAGFENDGIYPQTFGIATIYAARKPKI